MSLIKQKGGRTLEQAVLAQFPTRVDQLWSWDVHGVDWDDNRVLVTVKFVRTGKADEYTVAGGPFPEVDTYSLSVHCTFGRILVMKASVSAESLAPLPRPQKRKEKP